VKVSWDDDIPNIYRKIKMFQTTKTSSGWWFQPNPSEKYDIVSWDDFPFPIYGKS